MNDTDNPVRPGSVRVIPGDPRYCWNPYRHQPHTHEYDLMDGRTGRVNCFDWGDFAAGNIGWTAGLRDVKIPVERVRILLDVDAQRHQRDPHGGSRHLPDRTGGSTAAGAAEEVRRARERAFTEGYGGWSDLVHDEVWALFAVDNEEGEGLAELRARAVQAMATLAEWVEDIDYRVQLGEAP